MPNYKYDSSNPFWEGLKAGHSVFGFIPDDIGEIVYCDSNNSKYEPDSEEKIHEKQVLSIIIPLLIAAACWLFFYEYVIFCAIVTIVLAFISYCSFGFCELSKVFEGKDFFVGTEGYAVIEFAETRDNIIAKDIHYFREFDDLLSAVEDEYRERRHQGTYCQFAAYSSSKGNKRHLVDQYYNHFSLIPDEEFFFWKWIETTWSKYKFAQMREAYDNGEAIGFNVYSIKGYANNYIMLKGKEIAVGGVVYNYVNTKEIFISNAELVIYQKNNESSSRGDTIVIPLHDIGNRDLFSKIFLVWKIDFYPVDDPNHVDLFRSMVVTEEEGSEQDFASEEIDEEEKEGENVFEEEISDEDFDPILDLDSILPEDEIGTLEYDKREWIWDPSQIMSNSGWNKKILWSKP